MPFPKPLRLTLIKNSVGFFKVPGSHQKTSKTRWKLFSDDMQTKNHIFSFEERLVFVVFLYFHGQTVGGSFLFSILGWI